MEEADCEGTLKIKDDIRKARRILVMKHQMKRLLGYFSMIKDKRTHLYSIITTLFKKRPNLLNSAPISTESALWLLSAPSVRV
jgi:hypothetical protein